MKFYRTSITHAGESWGYSWWTTECEAAADLESLTRSGLQASTTKVEIKLTPEGVLSALRRFASYPDNG